MLPFVSARSVRGGALSAGPAGGGGAAEESAASADDVADMSPVWWLDADAEYVEEGSSDPVETDGDTVTTWLDRSGNDRDWVQSSAGYAPHWYSSGTNSKPYVHLDADKIKWAADATYSTPITMYFVLSSDTDTQQAKKFWDGAKDMLSWNYASRTKAFINYFGHGGAQYYDNIQSTDTQIWQVLSSGSANTMRLNGGADEGVDQGAASATSDDLIASGNTFTLADGYAFKLYEWVVINDVTHNQDTVFSYLGDKYDISVEDVE